MGRAPRASVTIYLPWRDPSMCHVKFTYYVNIIAVFHVVAGQGEVGQTDTRPLPHQL